MILKFRYCEICRTVNELNYVYKIGGCKKCGAMMFRGIANLSPLRQWIYVLIRPFYWPHLFKGDK